MQQNHGDVKVAKRKFCDEFATELDGQNPPNKKFFYRNNEKFEELENIFKNSDDITNQLRLQTKSKTHCSIWSPKYLPVKLSSIGILFICY